jgi:hypothetical protein
VVIIGHLGGIDEIGIFVVPAVLAILALRWAERRAQRRAAEEEDWTSTPEGEASEGGNPV